jgi:hypothetical protein
MFIPPYKLLQVETQLFFFMTKVKLFSSLKIYSGNFFDLHYTVLPR